MSEIVLASRLAELKTRIDDDLQRILHHTDWPPSLKEAVSYSLMAGGKRLRPMLSLLAAEICGASAEEALPAACAVEMVHTYSLIHDDLPAMDDDDLRRGRPTSHRVFGEALAILSGDCLLTLAFQMICSSGAAAACQSEQVRLLATAAGGAGMVGGQVLDLEAEGQADEWSDKTDPSEIDVRRRFGLNNPSVDPVQHLIQIHSLKTGAMITMALELGAVAAGASSRDRQRLVDYGRAAGLAFQIADDLLDVAGNHARLGKTTGRDQDLGKLTYPGLIGVQESRRKAEELVEQACQAIEPFGDRRTWLVELARFIVERDH
jgi:geranylgeranyl diphosphate synthase, type II